MTLWLKTVLAAGVAGVLSTGSLFAADAAVDGAKLYATKCASCHAKDGKGNPGMVKALKLEAAKLSLVTPESIAKTDEELIKVTTDGVGKMPAYKTKLKAEEIAAVVAYIRTLAPKPAN